MTRRVPFHPITTEFYRKLPEGTPYYQLIEGCLMMSPSPNYYHQKIAGRLYHYIETYLEENTISYHSDLG